MAQVNMRFQLIFYRHFRDSLRQKEFIGVNADAQVLRFVVVHQGDSVVHANVALVKRFLLRRMPLN